MLRALAELSAMMLSIAGAGVLLAKDVPRCGNPRRASPRWLVSEKLRHSFAVCCRSADRTASVLQSAALIAVKPIPQICFGFSVRCAGSILRAAFRRIASRSWRGVVQNGKK
ncbi:hypothetical protein [Sphingomonas hengshuiensis]|uniref:hypothetical protein n=1 Tax=Sphingomonas hengshuiensis TaxID=1609977 RepID=UPI0012B9C4A5|nr:hypothetical protein [Sphingomonas hengshuiensis]